MEEKNNITKKEKDVKFLPRFSYTKISCLEQCGFKYKLQYIDKNYFFDNTIATEIGSLVHYIEETIARTLKAGLQVNYEQLKDMFINLDKKPEKETNILEPNSSSNKSDKEEILGVKAISEKYKKDFYEIDGNGQSYYSKCQDYLNYGIYRLENFLKENPEWEIFDVEHEFLIPYHEDFALYGFIDRIFKNKITGAFRIEDIKTKDHPFDDKQLVTPLQFVTYAIGLKTQLNLADYPVEFYYDLPFCDLRQKAGTNGFINRGIKKLDKLLEQSKSDTFAPKPSPLCHWCVFCPTNQNQPEEAKYKCPYFSLWTPGGTAKSWDVMNQWEGKERHELILKRFLLEQQGPGKDLHVVKVDFDF